jgi:small nuclear ribonucleoprotein D3|mmetsp:Transcript_12658/g.21441  ORF Transcript_12658/g.21441 Transcript_12658/m.21441 type:complete len:124 (+) Transcript_12658:233-604(+)|eukprot:CAMPEP_0198209514 /NCGR_PEP_ID=MMETSP1445-20131203/16612_1 /TAXON_ID=36898 /ORGANISM="Pyramimonas sp., Strain CCMP2087" /LENGTH=123 /DNA_ID=CAMNT_0043883321 /DNA_START=194 /DNA_END=565 /DNA_ORIENTATION=+
MSKGIGIPIKLLHESEGHTVTIEMKTGETYRGQLLESEDNWNCQMGEVTFTAKDGKVSKLEHIFLRGSKIRFLIIPDMLKNAPMFKRIDPKIKKATAMGAGRGRAIAMRAKARGDAKTKAPPR